MKIKTFVCGMLFIFGGFGLLNAKIDAVKTLPPLTLKAGSEAQIASFKNNRITIDLHNRYKFLAGGIGGGGDITAFVKRLREYQKADAAYWADMAAKELVEPKKPENKGKGKQAKQAFAQAMKSYERRLAAANERHTNQQAVANAYLTWLSDGVLPWIETLKN